MPDPTADTITSFITRSEKSGGSEKANNALFITELCDETLLVPHPEPAGPEAVRLGTPLTAKEKVIHDHGLVSILKQIHDDLDTAVLEAYGWTDLISPTPLADRLAAPGPPCGSLGTRTLGHRCVQPWA